MQGMLSILYILQSFDLIFGSFETDLWIKDFARVPVGTLSSKLHMKVALRHIKTFTLMPQQIHSKYGC